MFINFTDLTKSFYAKRYVLNCNNTICYQLNYHKCPECNKYFESNKQNFTILKCSKCNIEKFVCLDCNEKIKKCIDDFPCLDCQCEDKIMCPNCLYSSSKDLVVIKCSNCSNYNLICKNHYSEQSHDCFNYSCYICKKTGCYVCLDFDEKHNGWVCNDHNWINNFEN